VPYSVFAYKRFLLPVPELLKKTTRNPFKIAESFPWALATVNVLNKNEACWHLVCYITNI
jgi:hypothetical protein